MTEENATPIEEAAKPPAAGKLRKILLAIAALAGLAGAGTGAWALLSKEAPEAKADAAATAPGPPKEILHLEGFTVNLADTENNSFLRVSMDLGLDPPPEASEGKSKEGARSQTPILRDSILSVLSTYRADQLLTQEGKTKLKTDLLVAIQRRSPELKVREIYFTDFLVQR